MDPGFRAARGHKNMLHAEIQSQFKGETAGWAGIFTASVLYTDIPYMCMHISVIATRALSHAKTKTSADNSPSMHALQQLLIHLLRPVIHASGLMITHRALETANLLARV